LPYAAAGGDEEMSSEDKRHKESVKTVTRTEARATGMPREALIALHETDGVGRLTIAKAFQQGVLSGPGSLRRATEFRAGDWREFGLNAKQALAAEASLREDARERRENRRKSERTEIVTYLDSGYPKMLARISDPPWVLYCIGRRELLANPAIAIVGTRMATAYGRKAAEDLGAGCARRMAVVSGLARGIDAAAHGGALNGPCGTIGVLAGEVGRCYPPENKALYREMAESGLIVSESPPGTILRPGLFPLRNRIIAGLSYGVIVVEAADRSGALITADLALGYDRDVFIVPGPVTSPRSQGALRYFRKGAHAAIDASDVFEMYARRLPPEPVRDRPGPAAAEAPEEEERWSDDELRIYGFLLDGPSSVDDLAARSGMTFGHLHSVLLSLLIKRRIQQQPGSVYHVL